MIGTLAANSHDISLVPHETVSEFIDIYSSSALLQSENIDKFVEYFGDLQTYISFRADFLNIDDEQKNDTLYHDIDEDAHNQYLILLYCVPQSEHPETTTLELIDKYYAEKFTKMIKQKILLKKMRQPLMNFALRCKSNIRKHSLTNIALHEYNWAVSNTTYKADYAIRLLKANSSSVESLKKLFEIQSTMINIFYNQFSIRNSLDVHFITTKLDELHDCLINCFQAQGKSNQEEEKHLDSEHSDEESFNPFIEIGEDKEEKQFVDASASNHDFDIAASSLCLTLAQLVDKFSRSLNKWLDSMPEPESLTIDAKQAALYKKLKWEKLASSSDKIKRLQLVLKLIRAKKRANK